MRALRRGLLLITAVLFSSGIGFAQSNAEFYANGNGGVQTTDLEFMNRAAQEGMAKILFANVALNNAHSEEVKAFARQILLEVGNANAALANMASEMFIALPTEIDAKDKATLNSLSQLQGENFDKAYMKAMLNGHRTDLDQFKHEAKTGNNQAIINWANQNLPALQSQYKEAEKVAPTVGVEAAEKKDKAQSDTAAQSHN